MADLVKTLTIDDQQAIDALHRIADGAKSTAEALDSMGAGAGKGAAKTVSNLSDMTSALGSLERAAGIVADKTGVALAGMLERVAMRAETTSKATGELVRSQEESAAISAKLAEQYKVTADGAEEVARVYQELKVEELACAEAGEGLAEAQERVAKGTREAYLAAREHFEQLKLSTEASVNYASKLDSYLSKTDDVYAAEKRIASGKAELVQVYEALGHAVANNTIEAQRATETELRLLGEEAKLASIQRDLTESRITGAQALKAITTSLMEYTDAATRAAVAGADIANVNRSAPGQFLSEHESRFFAKNFENEQGASADERLAEQRAQRDGFVQLSEDELVKRRAYNAEIEALRASDFASEREHTEAEIAEWRRKANAIVEARMLASGRAPSRDAQIEADRIALEDAKSRGFNPNAGSSSGASSAASDASAANAMTARIAATEKLREKYGLLTQEELASARATQFDADVNKLLARSLIDVADAEKLKADYTKASNEGTISLGGSTAMLTREYVILGHEIMTGQWNKIPGHLVVMAEYMPQMQVGIRALTDPFNALGVVAVGVFAAIGFAAAQAGAQMTALKVSMQATGGALGLTPGQLDRMAMTASTASHEAATPYRDIGMAAANAGWTNAPVLQTVMSASAGYAAATGQDVDEAGKALVKMLSDPVSAAENLQKQYHLLTAAEREHLDSLVAQGHEEEAQAILAEKLNDRFKDLNDVGLNMLGRGLRDVTDLWHDFWNAAGNLGKAATPESELEAARKALADLKKPENQRVAVSTDMGDFVIGPPAGAMSEAEARVKRAEDVQARSQALAKEIGADALRQSQIQGGYDVGKSLLADDSRRLVLAQQVDKSETALQATKANRDAFLAQGPASGSETAVEAYSVKLQKLNDEYERMSNVADAALRANNSFRDALQSAGHALDNALGLAGTPEGPARDRLTAQQHADEIARNATNGDGEALSKSYMQKYDVGVGMSQGDKIAGYEREAEATKRLAEATAGGSEATKAASLVNEINALKLGDDAKANAALTQALLDRYDAQVKLTGAQQDAEMSQKALEAAAGAYLATGQLEYLQKVIELESKRTAELHNQIAAVDALRTKQVSQASTGASGSALDMAVAQAIRPGNEDFKGRAVRDELSSGHEFLIGHGLSVGPDGGAIKEGDTISPEQDQALLKVEMQKRVDWVLTTFTRKLKANQVAALADLKFNLNDASDLSTIIKDVNAGNDAQVGKDFALYNKAGGVAQPGLTRRRAEDAALWNGDSSAAGAALDAEAEGRAKVAESAGAQSEAINKLKAIQSGLADGSLTAADAQKDFDLWIQAVSAHAKDGTKSVSDYYDQLSQVSDFLLQKKGGLALASGNEHNATLTELTGQLKAGLIDPKDWQDELDNMNHRNALEAQYGDAATKDGKSIVELLQDQYETQKELTDQADQTLAVYQAHQKAMQDIAEMGENAFDRIGSSIVNAFGSGNGAAKGLLSTVKTIESEFTQKFFQLAVTNPIENAVFGTDAKNPRPTISEMFSGGSSGGGSFLSLLGGSNQNVGFSVGSDGNLYLNQGSNPGNSGSSGIFGSLSGGSSSSGNPIVDSLTNLVKNQAESYIKDQFTSYISDQYQGSWLQSIFGGGSPAATSANGYGLSAGTYSSFTGQSIFDGGTASGVPSLSLTAPALGDSAGAAAGGWGAGSTTVIDAYTPAASVAYGSAGETAGTLTAADATASVSSEAAGSSMGAMGAMGAGAAGGAVGGMVGSQVGTATDSRAYGALTGAGTGAAIGGLMGGWWGAAAGAVIGGIMGGLGTQKTSAGPNGDAEMNFSNGSFVPGAAAGDNGYSVAGISGQSIQLVNTLNALKAYGVQYDASQIQNPMAISAAAGSSPNDTNGLTNSSADDIINKLVVGLNGGTAAAGSNGAFTGAPGSAVAAAMSFMHVQDINHQDPVTLAQLQQVVTLAAALDTATKAANNFGVGLDGTTKAAQNAADMNNDQIATQLYQAQANGIGTIWQNTEQQSLNNQQASLLDPSSTTSLGKQLATVQGQLKGIADNAAAAGVTVTDPSKMLGAWDATQIQNALGGVGAAYNQALAIMQEHNQNVSVLQGAGLDTSSADQLFQQELNKLFAQIGPVLSQQLATSMGGVIAEAYAATAPTPSTYDIRQAQAKTALTGLQDGSGSVAAVQAQQAAQALQIQAQQAQELNAATDATTKTLIQQTQAQENLATAAQNALAIQQAQITQAQTEASVGQGMLSLMGLTGQAASQVASINAQQMILNYQKSAGTNADLTGITQLADATSDKAVADAYKQQLLTAYSQQIQHLNDNSSALKLQYGALLQLSQSFEAATQQWTISNPSNTPQQTLAAYQTAFNQAVSEFNNATNQADKAKYGQQVEQYGQGLMQANYQYYGGVAGSGYTNATIQGVDSQVLNTWKRLGGVPQSTLDAANTQINDNTDAVAALQQGQTLANELGQQQVGSIQSLTTATTDVYAKFQTDLSGMSTSTTAMATGVQQLVQLGTSALTALTAIAANGNAAGAGSGGAGLHPSSALYGPNGYKANTDAGSGMTSIAGYNLPVSGFNGTDGAWGPGGRYFDPTNAALQGAASSESAAVYDALTAGFPSDPNAPGGVAAMQAVGSGFGNAADVAAAAAAAVAKAYGTGGSAADISAAISAAGAQYGFTPSQMAAALATASGAASSITPGALSATSLAIQSAPSSLINAINNGLPLPAGVTAAQYQAALAGSNASGTTATSAATLAGYQSTHPVTAMVNGGIVGAFADGGLVGNGIYNQDSVRARYAGGGDIMLAGGEYVIPAPVVTAIRGGAVTAPTNDNSALLAELQQIRAQLTALTNGTQVGLGMIADNTGATASGVSQVVANSRMPAQRRAGGMM